MIRCLKCMQIFDEAFDVCPHCGQLVGAAPEIAFHIFPGTVIGDRYVIGTALGHGGFGITYNAWDKKLNVHVAIKEYYPNGLVNRIPGTTEVLLLSGEKEKQYYDGLGRFLDEARQTIKFSGHPNIVQVFDFFEANHTAYIVMEFLDGISLKDFMKQWKGPMPVDQSIDICVSVCDALTEMHKHEILHRDVNPSNIFLCVNSGTKLIDFGNARVSDEEKEKTRSIIITPGYAPPEQYRAKSKQGGWTDIYAVCAVLYRLVTGQRPVESLDRSVDDTLDNPMVLNPEVEEWLDKVIMRGMALSQEIRFRTAEELKKALLEHQEVEYPEEKIRARKKARIIGISCAAAAIIAGGAGAAVWFLANRTVSLADMKYDPAEIEIWVEEGDGECYESVAEAFDKAYGADRDITVKVTEVSSEEYADKLAEAVKNDECPDVFLTEYLSEDDYSVLADLSLIYDSLDLDSYKLLEDYRETDDSEIMIPLGYDQLSLFVNKSETGLEYAEDEESESDKAIHSFVIGEDDALASGAAAGELTFEKFMKDKFGTFGQNFEYSEAAAESFSNQESAWFAAGAGAYKEIQGICGEAESVADTVAGNYFAVPVIYEGKACGVLEDKVGISESSENQENAARLFIAYLLSEQAQDIIHIQNEGELPLHIGEAPEAPGEEREGAFSRFTEYNNMTDFIGEADSIKIIN